ncbi:hypothetical protein [Aquibacillus rhizosphaerae]|uniref:Uncharacterized protein n=1 Tax=Aquibacillus rhizosphaerae TaxID=3051431 RepID=A0ABT7L5U2_9BACI|nr:hypothetical protein [Aquibacillus sp. LR5S19]MDL4841231.1 hypothetical protein [Aquibacillus sp. LR5S19]
MSVGHYHELCTRYMKKPVVIRTVDGKVHQGIIEHVDRHKVYISPLGGSGPHRNLGGYGYGFWGPGAGFGTGILLGSIVGLSLAPWFWI